MKRPLFIIFLTVFIDLLGFGIVLPLLPRYARRFEADAATLGLLMSSFSAMQFVFAPLWGRLSDRVGRRPVLIFGLAASAVFYSLFGYATLVESLAWLFVARIGAGIAGATIPTAQAYIADSTSLAERGRGMALIGAAFGIGFTFGPLLGAVAVTSTSSGPPSAAPGFVAGALSATACALAVLILPESLRPDSASAARRWLDLDALRGSLAVPSVALLLVTFFVATFAFANFEGTISLLTKDAFDFSDRSNFLVFAYIGFVLAVAQGVLVRRFLPRLGETKMMIAGTILMTAGLLGIGHAAHEGSSTVVFAVVPIAVVGFSALTPSVQSLISRRSDPAKQGGILGLGQSAAALARILGPFVGLVLYGSPQSGGPHYSRPYYFGAGAMAVALLLCLGTRRGRDWQPGSEGPAVAS